MYVVYSTLANMKSFVLCASVSIQQSDSRPSHEACLNYETNYAFISAMLRLPIQQKRYHPSRDARPQLGMVGLRGIPLKHKTGYLCVPTKLPFTRNLSVAGAGASSPSVKSNMQLMQSFPKEVQDGLWDVRSE